MSIVPMKMETPAASLMPIEPQTLEEVYRFADLIVKSGMFGAVNVHDAAFRILYGRSLGLTSMQSMMGIESIKGRPALKAVTIGAIIQNSGRFEYRVREWTKEICRIEFFERGKSLGFSEFTREDAKTAGLIRSDSGWEKYPRSMPLWRALSQGGRAYCSSVLLGIQYSAEELMDDVEIVEPAEIAPTVTVTPSHPDPQPPKEPEVDPVTDKIRRYDAWATDVAKRLGNKGFAAFKTSGAVTEFIYGDISGAGFADGAAKSYRDRVKAIASLDMEWKELLETLNAIALRLLGKLEQEAAEQEPGSEG